MWDRDTCRNKNRAIVNKTTCNSIYPHRQISANTSLCTIFPPNSVPSVCAPIVHKAAVLKKRCLTLKTEFYTVGVVCLCVCISLSICLLNVFRSLLGRLSRHLVGIFAIKKQDHRGHWLKIGTRKQLQQSKAYVV